MFWRKKPTRRTAKKPSRITLWLWRALLCGFLLIALDAFYLAIRLPNWDSYADGPIKKSRFIERYEAERAEHKDWPTLSWKPVPLSSMPGHLIRIVVIAEDSRFFSHSGVDTEAIQDAIEHGLAKKRFVYGGSTLSQQTVKNLFFSASRNPLRKIHEIVFAYSMERHLKKRRIIETYLNIAEFGRGIYGVAAAAQHYFHKPVSALSAAEAIELAATLPGPVQHNPASRTRFFLRHKQTVERHYAATLRPVPTTPTAPSEDRAEDVLEEELLPTEPDDQDAQPITPSGDQGAQPAAPADETPQPPDAPAPVEITPE